MSCSHWLSPFSHSRLTAVGTLFAPLGGYGLPGGVGGVLHPGTGRSALTVMVSEPPLDVTRMVARFSPYIISERSTLTVWEIFSDSPAFPDSGDTVSQGRSGLNWYSSVVTPEVSALSSLSFRTVMTVLSLLEPKLMSDVETTRSASTSQQLTTARRSTRSAFRARFKRPCGPTKRGMDKFALFGMIDVVRENAGRFGGHNGPPILTWRPDAKKGSAELRRTPTSNFRPAAAGQRVVKLHTGLDLDSSSVRATTFQ